MAKILTGGQKVSVEEVATRSSSAFWWYVLDWLPDPDPILESAGVALSVYEKMLYDDEITFAIGQRKAGTLRCDWRIAVQEDSGRGGEIREFVESELDETWMGNLINELLDAVYFGFAVAEVMWAKKGERIGIERIVGKPAKWFCFGQENELRFKTKQNMVSGVPVPERKFILVQHQATYVNPYGKRLLSSCYWPWVFKKNGLKYWAIFVEKFGVPYLVGKYGRGADDREIRDLLNALEQMVQDAVAAIPEDGSVEVIELKGSSGQAEIHKSFYDQMRMAIQKVILGQTLTGEIGERGSYAAARAHLQVRKDLVESDKRLVAQGIQQAIDWLVELNFGEVKAEEWPYFTWEKEMVDVEERKARVEADYRLWQMGVDIPRDYITEHYDIPEPDEGEVALPKPYEVQAVRGEDSAEFAWGDEGQFTVEQQNLEGLVRRCVEKGGEEVDRGVLRYIVREIERAKDWGEAERRVKEVYDRLKLKGLGEVIGRGLFMAECYGRYAAMKDWTTEFAVEERLEMEPLAFREAIEFWREKVPMTIEEFRALSEELRARGFTTALVSGMDLVMDIYRELEQAIESGMSFQEWKGRVNERLEARGWSGLKRWRLETIFHSNLQSAYMAGRWKQVQRVKEERPYLMYDAVNDERTRPEHAAMDGLIFPVDHPFWDKYYPPNGYRCRCVVRSVSKKDLPALERKGLRVQEKIPEYGWAGGKRVKIDVDKGWAFNVGKVIWQPDFGKYPDWLRERYFKQASK